MLKKFPDDYHVPKDTELICSLCSSAFIKKISLCSISVKGFKAICNECIKKKISKSIKLQHDKKAKNIEYHQLGLVYRRKIIWEDQKEKCNICGYNNYTLDTGPYQLHHKDGNSKNKNRNNEEILCCNCHTLTDNFGFKNRNHTQESKLKISENHWAHSSVG